MTLPRVEFLINTPLDANTISAHIAHALSLGLPEADAEPLKRLTIIANGPSARDAPLDGETLCFNGAINLFANSGRSPTYWAGCDPQANLANLLPETPPKDTIYFVASKCHPSVFEKLKGYDVRLWHINDHPLPEGTRSIACASSVTLVALGLMRRLGYRQFDIYGWDGCYEEVAEGVILHHASDPSISQYPEDTTLNLCVGATELPAGGFEGGTWFKTSRTWAAEGKDAVTVLHYGDYNATIHGNGFIKAMIANARPAPT